MEILTEIIKNGGIINTIDLPLGCRLNRGPHMPQNQQENFERLYGTLQDILSSEEYKTHLPEWIDTIQPADLAAVLNDCSFEEQITLYSSLSSSEDKMELISFLEGEPLKNVLSVIHTDELVAYIHDMAPDEAVDTLEELESEKVDQVLNKLEAEKAIEIRTLRKYREGSAGSLMTTDFLEVKSHARVSDVLSILRDSDSDLETIDTGFVLTEGGKILGMFDVKDLLVLPEKSFLLKHIDEDVITIADTSPTEEVYQMMTHHSLSVLPVTDNGGKMVGIITADDVLDEVRTIVDEDFYHMVGTTGDPSGRGVFGRVVHRVPWLASTLIGGSIAAVIMNLFGVNKIVTSFVPFVMAIAGNVGVQSATIIVRELVNQEFSSHHLQESIKKEILTGWVNAAIFGVLAFVLLFVVAQFSDVSTLSLALGVGIGVFGAMCFAAVMGGIAPLMFTYFKIDPAISSGPIIMVTTDIVGLTIYLSVVSAIFSVFGTPIVG